MIVEIQDDIVTQLKTISGIAETDSYVGDVEDIVNTPQRMPSLHVVYQGADFSPKKVIGSDQADHTMDFLVVLVARNVRSRTEGAESAQAIIESVRTALTGHVIGNYGYLWPISEDLLISLKGVLCYGLKYRIATKTE